MLKSTAIKMLGGTPTSAAAEIGVSPSAVSQWPDVLSRRIEDRVLAALARKHLPRELIDQVTADRAAAEEVRDAA
ncbi:MAG: hypothetical protein KF683_01280 [Rubrivivax sp.]|nr:hypothetical protein [Rubrivivax sp.]